MDRILVAIDGSRGSTAAIEHGLDLARELGADVRFVAVLARPAPWLLPAEEPTREQTRLGRALSRALVTAAAAGVAASEELAEGPTVDEILRVADAYDVDLIVVGSRGHGGVRAALGSVSRGLVAKARRPVLVVHSTPAVPAAEPAVLAAGPGA